MTYEVFLHDVMKQYYAYMRHALREDGRPGWQLAHNEPAFIDRWFTAEGMRQLRIDAGDGKVLCKLEFDSRERLVAWLLRWS
jgi:hypothetical protein